MIAIPLQYQAETTNQLETTTKYQVELGRTYPLGAKPDKYGVNFSIFSEHATSVELLLFETPNNMRHLSNCCCLRHLMTQNL